MGYYAINGMSRSEHRKAEQRCGAPIHSLFWLPLGPPIEQSVRELWQSRVKRWHDALTAEQGADTSSSWRPAVLKALESYLPKPLAKKADAAPVSESGVNQLRQALEEGHEGASGRLRRSIRGVPETSVVKYLDVKDVAVDPLVRNRLHGFLGNHMPPRFLAWCASALTIAGDRSWLSKDWLVLHRGLLDADESLRDSLLCHAYALAQDGPAEDIQRVRKALEEVWLSSQRQSSAADTATPLQVRVAQSLLAEAI